MGKTKGKVNEQSLEVLKKSIKAGGKTKKKQKPKEKKPATPAPQGRNSRSRSRSRTPGRPRKSPPLASRPAIEKKVQARKPGVAGKVKRLDEDKSAATRRSRGRPSTKIQTQQSYKLRPKVQTAVVEDTETKSAASIQEATSDAVDVNNISGPKASSPTVVSGNSNNGWFSKCIIS